MFRTNYELILTPESNVKFIGDAALMKELLDRFDSISNLPSIGLEDYNAVSDGDSWFILDMSQPSLRGKFGSELYNLVSKTLNQITATLESSKATVDMIQALHNNGYKSIGDVIAGMVSDFGLDIDEVKKNIIKKKENCDCNTCEAKNICPGNK